MVKLKDFCNLKRGDKIKVFGHIRIVKFLRGNRVAYDTKTLGQSSCHYSEIKEIIKNEN